jgi:16S rRNA A1518/A1519 N6-dimethyltransferase RsmA/KsgA/DIM1 with predicted DNA glycosylase/AP lyase activity
MVIDPEGHEAAALAARIPRGCRVIEIGCGDGRVTRRYSDRMRSVIACDSDVEAIAAFRAAGVPVNVTVHAVSVDQFAAPEASVDVVLFSWAL